MRIMFGAPGLWFKGGTSATDADDEDKNDGQASLYEHQIADRCMWTSEFEVELRVHHFKSRFAVHSASFRFYSANAYPAAVVQVIPGGRCGGQYTARMPRRAGKSLVFARNDESWWEPSKAGDLES